ncbi:MAG: arsenite methyltransferase [Saprospiraceae bacterium]
MKTMPVDEKTSNCCAPSCCGDTAIIDQEAANLKSIVKEKYGAIARQSQAGSPCCGDNMDYSIMSEEYKDISGYVPDADLKLGCGLPVEFALIKKGDTVVDLGAGAGNDCFVARAETEPEGQVIGVDFTQDMLMKARTNALKLGFNNVSFVEGDIENIPLPDNIADVVVSNCVFNLVPDKQRAFASTFRILKPGGHFSISDIVLEGALPKALQHDASMYAGCVSGAIQMEEYLGLLKAQGFANITVQKKKAIELPLSVLEQHLSADDIARFSRDFGIYSITVYGEKATA